MGRLLIVVALVLGALSFVDVQTAVAKECHWEAAEGKRLTHVCEDNQSSQEGSDDDGEEGGSSEPSCDTSLTDVFALSSATRWCEGENACWANIPSYVYPTEDTWPEDPPTEDSVYIYKECYAPDGSTVYSDWTWYIPDETSLEDLALEAYGNLEAPDFTLAFSPPEETVVFIDTWWWADGAPDGNLKGTAALGVAAVAEPDHMEVDPGDGSGTITCDFVTTESDACTYVYEKASDGDGYTARARLIYDVHFEQNGETFQVTSAPDTFETDWIEATVPVTEVQATVVR